MSALRLSSVCSLSSPTDKHARDRSETQPFSRLGQCASDTVQVDEALLALSTACNCSLMGLITQHSTTLLELLHPVPDSVHAAADLVAYSYLLLPWTAILHATQAVTTAVASQPQLPQLPQALYAEVFEQQSEDLQCVRFEPCTPVRGRPIKHADCVPVWLKASHDLARAYLSTNIVRYDVKDTHRSAWIGQSGNAE